MARPHTYMTGFFARPPEPVGPPHVERATLDEFDFNAYPRAAPTWTEDHPPWWVRLQRGYW